MKYLWHHKRRLWVLLADVLLVAIAYLTANLIRFEGHITARDLVIIWNALPLLMGDPTVSSVSREIPPVDADSCTDLELAVRMGDPLVLEQLVNLA